MTQNDPRILTKRELEVIFDETVYECEAASQNMASLERHIDALAEALSWYGNEKVYREGFLHSNDGSWYGSLIEDDGGQRARDVLSQIDPPPPAQTISAARLDGKVRL